MRIRKCCVANCGNQGSRAIPLLRVPKDQKESDEWRELCQIPPHLTDPRVCYVHFNDEDFERDLRAELMKLPPKRVLKPFVKPSRKLPSNEETTDKPKEFDVNVSEIINNDDVLCIVRVFEDTESGSNRKSSRSRKKKGKIIEAVQTDSSLKNHFNTVSSKRKKRLHNVSTDVSEKKSKNTPSKAKKIKKGSSDDDIDYSAKAKVLEDRVQSLLEKLRGMEAEKEELMHKNINLISRLQSKEEALGEAECEMEDALNGVLTNNQIEMLKKKKTRVAAWDQEDLKRALTLRGLSIKSYDFLKIEWRFPLPSSTTLNKWVVKTFPFTSPQFVYDVINLMGSQVEEKKSPDNVCVLTLNAKLSSYLANHVGDRKVHLGSLRGIFKSWEQPIYFQSDTNGPRELLLNTIIAVESSGYRVAAVIADSETTKFLASTCEIGKDDSLVNPADSRRKVWVMEPTPNASKVFAEYLNQVSFFANAPVSNNCTTLP